MIEKEIEFAKLENWIYPNIKAYQYDFISDAEIHIAIKNLDRVDPVIAINGWYELTTNYSTKEDNPFHIENVANLVKFITQGNILDPITIRAEEDIRDMSGFCIIDGHHRARALKYLKASSINVILKGNYKDYSFLLS